MKKCSICKQIKSKSDFNKKSSSKDNLQSKCRKCSRTLQRKWYEKNKQSHYKVVKRNNARYTNRNREFIYQYLLTHPCVDCEEDNPILLDFDHLKDKYKDVSKMVVAAASIKSLEKEIAKCEIRCVKCHRKKTAKQFNWWIHQRHYNSS